MKTSNILLWLTTIRTFQECEISGLSWGVKEIFGLLGFYTLQTGRWLQKFGTTYRSHLQGSRRANIWHFEYIHFIYESPPNMTSLLPKRDIISGSTSVRCLGKTSFQSTEYFFSFSKVSLPKTAPPPSTRNPYLPPATVFFGTILHLPISNLCSPVWTPKVLY